MINENSLKIRFFGDFTTAENYQAEYEIDYKTNILRQFGYDYLLKDTDIYFKNSFNIVNLESPITNVRQSELKGKKPCIHWMDYNIAGDFLKRHNVNAVSLGNNHGYDYTHDGLVQTIEVLDKYNISHFGAGLDEKTAQMPFFKTFEIKGRKLNLYVFGGFKYRKDYYEDFKFYAKGNKSGVNLLTVDTAKSQIQEIKQNDPDSLVVMFCHFGFDYMDKVSHQVEYAHGWIDFGADFVIGHGPHKMNEIEIYKGKTILYSIGNFCFPASFRNRMSPYNFVFELEIFENETKQHIYPIYFDTYSLGALSRPLKEDELNEFIQELCAENVELKEKIQIQKGDVICLTL